MSFMKRESGYSLPILIWSKSYQNIDTDALKQADNLAQLPFAVGNIAIMPDVHKGYGMPIGGVLATDKVIVPNAVGVDIGCGVQTMETNITKYSTEQLETIVDKVKRKVPVGFEHRNELHPLTKDLMPTYWHMNTKSVIVPMQYKNAQKQLGTLGGGNHFIEIQKSAKTGKLWLMIHSGSRNIGKKVADHYNNIAENLNKMWYTRVPSVYELAFLPIESQQAKSYKEEMEFCIDFARANRNLIMYILLEEIGIEFGFFEENGPIDVAHNYARFENHRGKNLIIHRKGATSAKKGEIGIIPGSQGTSSFIVRGLGNEASFKSCSHGAGRKMSRKFAKQQLSLENEKNRMKGIIHSMETEDQLDEAPSAYKDINKVMKNQKDLVEIIEELKPLAVVKG